MPLLRCAVAIGVIYALSPVRDPLPPASRLPGAPALSEVPARVETLSRLWGTLPAPTREILMDEAARAARERAGEALRGAPEKPRP